MARRETWRDWRRSWTSWASSIERMSFYMPLRLREFGSMGFSGFEARYYSLFPSYHGDMAPAVDLQQLLLMVAYQLALEGSGQANDIPDDPTSESERRQPFFFAAAGLPAFYVHKQSRNEMLGQILRHCKRTRSSWRHPDYLRVSDSRLPRGAVGMAGTECAGAAIAAAQAESNIIELRFRLLTEPAGQAAHRERA